MGNYIMIEWRRVTDIEDIPPYRWMKKITLSCGHVARRAVKDSPPRKLRCRKCEGDDEGKRDMEFSQMIRRRDGRCMLEGKDGVSCSGPIECAHYVYRGNSVLRRDPRNARALCRGHHQYYTGEEAAWRAIYERLWPEDFAYCEARRWEYHTRGV